MDCIEIKETFERAIKHTIKINAVLEMLDDRIIRRTKEVDFYLDDNISSLEHEVNKLIDMGLLYPKRKYKEHFNHLKRQEKEPRDLKYDAVEIYIILQDEFQRFVRHSE